MFILYVNEVFDSYYVLSYYIKLQYKMGQDFLNIYYGHFKYKFQDPDKSFGRTKTEYKIIF